MIPIKGEYMASMSTYMQSGVPGLDQVLRGGLPRNQMYVISGKSGSGKTTLAMQFLLEGARVGERSLYLGTSETEEEIRQIARSHGWSLEKVAVRHMHMDPAQKEVSQTMLHPAEVELPRTVEKMIKHIDEYQPQRVVIDSLSEIRLLARELSWYQRQLMMLKHHLTSRQCTVILTDTSSGEDPVTTVVHGSIELDRLEPLYGPERRRLRIEKLRGHDFISGFHDYRIKRGGLHVYPRLIAGKEQRVSFPSEKMSSGMDEFDALLGGGLDKGTCTLFQGTAGTGKSALATQFAVAAARRGEKSLIYCFDERIQTFVQRAQGLGIDIQKYMSEGLVIVRQVNPAELTAGEFSSMVAEAVNQKGISIVVIDSLNGYAYALPNEKFLSVHLHEIASFLNLQGVVTLLTMAQLGGAGLITEAPFEISYVSDTVIKLRYFEYRGSVRKSISVQKRRGGEHERTIRELIMDENGVQVGPVLEEFEGIISGNPRYVGKNLETNGSKD